MYLQSLYIQDDPKKSQRQPYHQQVNYAENNRETDKFSRKILLHVHQKKQ
jgi:hypothetical protein